MRAPDLIQDSNINGVRCYLLYPHEDNRGYNGEIFNQENYVDLPTFKLDSYSISQHGVIRGFHGDFENDKLIHVLWGLTKLVLIDCRPNSETFHNVSTYTAEIGKQIFVPAGVVNAHECLTDYCLFYYKWSKGYCPIDKQIHIKWNDPRFNIPWTTKNPILSERDK